MITKIFKVTDTCTLMYFLVTVFEAVDKPICEKIGVSPGFKIVNRMAGRVVDTFAGYKFDPDYEYESIEAQSRKYALDGTSNAFGLLLSEIEDIRKIPDTVSVEQIRKFWVMSSRTIFITDGILDTIRECDASNLRKCLYFTSSSQHIALIDTNSNKVVYDVGTSADLHYILPRYLWIPIREGEIEYLKQIDICWFMKGFVRPEA